MQKNNKFVCKIAKGYRPKNKSKQQWINKKLGQKEIL